MRYFITLLIFLTSQVSADTSMWKISNGSHELFIGGTIHLLGVSDYPLPEEFELAYQKADQVVFETDLKKMETASFQQKMFSRMSYTNGLTLESDLSPEVYSALKEYCKKKNIPFNLINQFKPMMVSITLLGIELERLGMAHAGVDSYFYTQASIDDIPVGELESVDEHLDFLAGMGLGQEDELILSTINEMEQLEGDLSSMKSAWRSGDNDKLKEIALVPLRQNYPRLYQDLLVKRNDNWFKQIKIMLTTPETELILVGALHLVGEKGLLQQLRRSGFKIEQF